MIHIPYLFDLVVLFGASTLVIALSHRLRVPPLVGYLLTGMLVGPHGLALIDETEHVEVFAEFGVVFLLFIIGLELSVERIKSLSQVILRGGPMQTGMTIAMVAAISMLAGVDILHSFYYGFLVALSSTAIVLKLYSDRREIEAPQGRISMGILLFQDFMIVPMLLLIPFLAGTATGSPSDVLVKFGSGLAVISVVFVCAWWMVPWLLHKLARTRIRELLVIGSLFLCLGAALLTEHFGFSAALGAFVAGILISRSPYHHQVVAETMPFRDVFNSIFFISVGMLLQLRFVAEFPLLIGVVALGLLVLKAVIVFVTVYLMKYPMRTAIITALGLAQIGEFSFVLIRAGYAQGLINEQAYQTVIAASVMTMILTPLLFVLAPRIAARIIRKHDVSLDKSEAKGVLKNHVIVVGFGLNGKHLVRVLRSTHTSYLVLDLDPLRVQKAKAAGESVMFGDASRRDILEAAGIEQAQLVVFAITDPKAVRTGIALARKLNPRIYQIVRTRQLTEIEDLQECGADEVIAEEFETSIEIVTRVLARLHVPGNIVRTESRLLRAGGYSMLREPKRMKGISTTVAKALEKGLTESYILTEEHEAVGKTIEELDLRRLTGTTIIAVVRGDQPVVSPPPDIKLNRGDILVLVGSHEAIESAFDLLDKKWNVEKEPQE